MANKPKKKLDLKKFKGGEQKLNNLIAKAKEQGTILTITKQ